MGAFKCVLIKTRICIIYRVYNSRASCTCAFFTCFLLHFSTESTTNSQPGQHAHSHTQRDSRTLVSIILIAFALRQLLPLSLPRSLSLSRPELIESIMKIHFVAILIELRYLRFIGPKCQTECSPRRMDAAFL